MGRAPQSRRTAVAGGTPGLPSRPPYLPTPALATPAPPQASHLTRIPPPRSSRLPFPAPFPPNSDPQESFFLWGPLDPTGLREWTQPAASAALLLPRRTRGGQRRIGVLFGSAPPDTSGLQLLPAMTTFGFRIGAAGQVGQGRNMGWLSGLFGGGGMSQRQLEERRQVRPRS